MKIRSLLFVLVTCISLPVYAVYAPEGSVSAQYEKAAPQVQDEEPIPLYTEIFNVSKGEVTSEWSCAMDNEEVYDCITVQFEQKDYVIAVDKKGIIGEWLLRDGETILLWKKEGMKFKSKNK